MFVKGAPGRGSREVWCIPAQRPQFRISVFNNRQKALVPLLNQILPQQKSTYFSKQVITTGIYIARFNQMIFGFNNVPYNLREAPFLTGSHCKQLFYVTYKNIYNCIWHLSILTLTPCKRKMRWYSQGSKVLKIVHFGVKYLQLTKIDSCNLDFFLQGGRSIPGE